MRDLQVKQRFGLVEPMSVYWDVDTEITTSSFDVPRDFQIKGLGGQMLLSYRCRSIGAVEMVLGLKDFRYELKL